MNRAAPAILIALVLAGCTAAPAPTGDDPVPFDERADDTAYPGDCFDIGGADDTFFDPIERIPCGDPHDLEVVAVLPQFDGTALLPELEMEALVRPLCIEQLDAVVASPLTELPLVTGYTGWLGDDDVTITGSIACTVFTENGEILSGSVLENDPHDVIGDWRLLRRLDVGDCFVLGEQGDLGMPTACAPGELMYLGAFDVADGEYPGTDGLRELRTEGCLPLLPQGVVPESLSGTFPTDDQWAIGVRTISCDAVVA